MSVFSMESAIAAAFAEDPVGASLLVDEAVSNWMIDELEAADEVVQKAIGDALVQRARFAKRQLGRSYAEEIAKGLYPDSDVVLTGEWLSGLELYAHVCKEQVTFTDARGNQRRQYLRRDAKGRFHATIDTMRKPVDPRGVRQSNLAPPVAAHLVEAKGNTKGAGMGAWQWAPGTDEGQKDRLSRHQDQYEQAAGYVASMYDAFGENNDGVDVEFVTRSLGGEMGHSSLPLKMFRRGFKGEIPGVNAMSDDILEVRLVASDPEQAAKVARFNAMGYLGDGMVGRLANAGGYSELFGTSGPEDSFTDKLFSRLKGGAQVLDAVPGADKAAQWARLIGETGPEAEKVLGPHVRRAAYRYRGTEKTPDAGLLRQFSSPEWDAVRRVAAGPAEAGEGGQWLSFREAVDQGAERNGDVPALGSYKFRRAQGADGDQLALQVGSDIAAAELIRQLPSERIVSALSEESGHVLPSQGVILSADGEVVSQAVGYADDHYLPFDLKNMAALRGGQYVRTRVMGGLTGEDVYAAVQSGARMVTVASKSGVYSMELAPDFRGARGNSDKARSMYTRYLKILDAVDNSELYAQDLPGNVKAQVKAQARSLSSGGSGLDFKDTYDRLLDRRREETRAGIDTDELWQRATDAVLEERGFAQLSRSQQAQRTEDVYDELVAAESGEAVRKLELNAEGYHVALKALQQQFPYFIRNVSYQPLTSKKDRNGFLETRGMRTTSGLVQSSGKDSGYVRPGALRPKTTRGGFYDPSGPELPKKARRGGAARGEAADEVPSEQRAAGSGGKGGDTAAVGTGQVSPSAPKLKVEARAEQFNEGVREATRKAAQEVADELINSGVAPTFDGRTEAAVGMQWPEAKALLKTDATKVSWALAHADQLPAVLEDPEGAAAFKNRQMVKGQLGSVYKDLFIRFDPELAPSEAGSAGEGFGGAQTKEELLNWVVDRLGSVADRQSVMTPFADVPANDTDGSGTAYHTGEKPLRSPLFNAGTVEELEQLTGSGDGLRAARVAAEFENVPDADKAMVGAIKLIAQMKRHRTQVQHEVGQSGDMSRWDNADVFARELGLSPKQLSEVTGFEHGVRRTSELTDEVLDRRAFDLQNARSLMATRSALTALGPEAGGAGPKVATVPATVPVTVPETKVGKASSSRHRVFVLPPDHPFAIEVALNKAAGLPLLRR